MPKVVQVYELGGPEKLILEDLPLPPPGPQEVQVAIQAIGLNRADVGLRTGTYVYQPPLPLRLGFEGAGIVSAVGDKVDGFGAGDFVSIVPAVRDFRYGSYADSANFLAANLVKLPTTVAPITAAAMWMQYLTAYGGLVEAGGLRAGEHVLITAASSSVGLAAIQIANKLGARPIAVTRGKQKVQGLRQAGAAEVIALEEGPLVEAVHSATAGRGADLVFDCVAGEGMHELGEAAAFNGRLVLYGALSGPAAPFPFFPAVKKGLTMRAFYLTELSDKPDWLARGKALTLAGVKDGSLTPIIDRTFALEDVRDAHRHLESNQQFGKIIMTTTHYGR